MPRIPSDFRLDPKRVFYREEFIPTISGNMVREADDGGHGRRKQRERDRSD